MGTGGSARPVATGLGRGHDVFDGGRLAATRTREVDHRRARRRADGRASTVG